MMALARGTVGARTRQDRWRPVQSPKPRGHWINRPPIQPSKATKRVSTDELVTLLRALGTWLAIWRRSALTYAPARSWRVATVVVALLGFIAGGMLLGNLGLTIAGVALLVTATVVGLFVGVLK